MVQLDKMNEKLLQTPNNEKHVFGVKDKVIDLFSGNLNVDD